VEEFLVAAALTGAATVHTALQHRSKRLWLLVSTLLVLVQPTAWAEGNMHKVGIVSFFSLDRSPNLKRAMDTIRASVPSQNVTFEFRIAEGKSDRYPQLVTDLVQQHVDVIFALPGSAAVAAQQVTTTVPIVFMIAANPVTLGLVKSLEKPGGNITGLYEELPDFQSKRMALLTGWYLKQKRSASFGMPTPGASELGARWRGGPKRQSSPQAPEPRLWPSEGRMIWNGHSHY
jgi:putative ABC transport system substrate-binding protein